MKIKDAVRLTGTSADTLRFYEKTGLLRIERKNGVRVFSEKDVERIHMISQLKAAGFLLKEIAFLFTLDEVIESPMQLSPKDERNLKDVRNLVCTKLNMTQEKISQMQESVRILGKMLTKLRDALQTGAMKGYEK